MFDVKRLETFVLNEHIQEQKVIQIDEVKSNRRPFIGAIEGKLSIEGQVITIQMALPKYFPIEKPMFFLKKPKALGFIPHVEPDGFVCYSHDEGLLLDQSNPYGILNEACQRAIKTLQEGILKKNNKDFQKEFESFWSRQKNKLQVDSIISTGDNYKQITVLLDETTGKTVLVDKLTPEINNYLQTLYKRDVVKEFKQEIGIYIPLRQGTIVNPPPYWNFWSFKQLKTVIYNNITAATKKQLNAYLKRRLLKRNENEYIFLSFPLENGQRILFGVLINKFRKLPNVKGKYPFLHPLKKVNTSFEIVPLSVKRHDRNYLLNRTQGNNTLIEKKVTILGLGSLGSRIVFELARAGVTSFNLFDKDFLDVDNIFRHELGVQHLYWLEDKTYKNISKALAISIELNNHFPSLNINHNNTDILELNNYEELINDSDLIIVALGNPTLELQLNKQLYQTESFIPVIFTWLDPLGIGGHALLTNNNGDKKGCFQCLFTHPEDNEILVSNRASFAGPGQFFGKTLAGCESVFTPYGSIDALQTAITATRLAINVLNRNESGNPLISWKGNEDELLNQEFKVSKRFELTHEQLIQSRYQYKTDNCPVCGKDATV